MASLVPAASTVLDAGCGSGVLSFLLARKQCQVVGVDMRSDCVQFAGRWLPQGQFFVADLRAFDLGRHFDVVVCADVIEHFRPETRAQVLANLERHLEEGGILILTVPSRAYHRLEPLWRVLRRCLFRLGTWDDERHHIFAETVPLHDSTVERTGSCCWGLINYIVARKNTRPQ